VLGLPASIWYMVTVCALAIGGAVALYAVEDAKGDLD
jgi:hypothetical protein